MTSNQLHTFHIPVMGLAYTIDSPIKVAKYGIASVISVMDDDLIERMNAFYSAKFNFPYQEITQKMFDFRAHRITSYLNLVDKIVKQKLEQLKSELLESKVVMDEYIAMLPDSSKIKKELQELLKNGSVLKEQLKSFIDKKLKAGAIDVNIMTKVDKDNFVRNKQLPIEFNDAHAALRGFANSELESSVVLSAGMNPRLYSYFEQFADFYPNKHQVIKKKIILKVSDFRSAMIQGSFLAKKGLWVSEYRIESGLNCGGHAFATDGYLLGAILEEFKTKKAELIQATHELLSKALLQKGKNVPEQPLELRITVQGGVGTGEEHQFLLDHYNVDSVGWGSPFLLVPEATTVDAATRELLSKATEADLFLSNISPLGVPFNSIKGTTNDAFRESRILKGKAGSACPKKYLVLNKEYSEQGLCTASKKYQEFKLNELERQKEELSREAYHTRFTEITEKSCLCVGLSNAALLDNKMDVKGEPQGVIICPGPNMAYFSGDVSLFRMVQHIYGKDNILPPNQERPHFFIKELRMYIDYFKKETSTLLRNTLNTKNNKLDKFHQNLMEGIRYYQDLFTNQEHYFMADKNNILHELAAIEAEITTYSH
ncbi:MULTISPECIES: hypothetical protein [unclassified Flavobacterium]|uniref:hypothetical protein n=1 Tax=unclassified Flavobacterium TaxID=196869 RepID=UPI0009661552|nr:MULTISPECIES: hypothetical protein [unclassified Flavobacterium]MBN9284422.1 hypothetical protein [Flavobacterium sp.]OJV72724.1 MAG: hypothetical protein BGO42_14930 [Flavobacterium sp. 40-81]